jgi:hypothetical protein
VGFNAWPILTWLRVETTDCRKATQYATALLAPTWHIVEILISIARRWIAENQDLSVKDSKDSSLQGVSRALDETPHDIQHLGEDCWVSNRESYSAS